MRIGRTLPPAAALLEWRDLGHAVAAMWSPDRAVQMREDEIKKHFGVPYACLVSSGTAALTLAFIALRDLSERTDVIIPAFTCYSVAAAVLTAGLRPVLCDVEPSTFDYDYARLPQTLSDNTLCVVAHHLFGVPADSERLRALCHSRGIFLVEDAAQAMGITVDGEYVGTKGDVGIFSFGRGKNVTSGSGGVIVARRDSIAEALARRCSCLEDPPRLQVWAELFRSMVMTAFIRPSLYWFPAALPFLRLGETIYPRKVALQRLSGMQAGLLQGWRERLNQSNEIRSNNATDLTRRLSLHPPQGQSHPYLRLPLLAATPGDKKRIFEMSRRQGLGMSVAYPATINQVPELRGQFDGGHYPGAAKLAQQLLTIPTHHLMEERDKKAITDCLATTMRTVPPAPDQRTTSSFEPAKASPLDISAAPSAGGQSVSARRARPGPLWGSRRAESSRNEPHSGPIHHG
jgi:dTDP-4-amino-4,6-dideoxygalactose transaminase